VGPGDAQSLRGLVAAPQADGIEQWIAEQQAGWAAGTHYTFAVHTCEGAFVGVVQLKRSPSAPRAELGFATLPALQGQGYATEACRAAVQFAFADLNLARISALCLGTNQASARVLEKLGFVLEARIEQDGPDGEPAGQLLIYGLTRAQ